MESQMMQVIYKVVDYVGIATSIFLALCAAVVIFFAIYVGFRLAKAEDDGKRKDAKDQLIYAIIGVIGIAVIAALLKGVIPMVGKAVSSEKSSISGEVGDGVSKALEAIRALVPAILDVVAAAGVIFSVWVGWKLMSAEDDGKRKQAKTQLIYVFVGVIAICVISLVATLILNSLRV